MPNPTTLTVKVPEIVEFDDWWQDTSFSNRRLWKWHKRTIRCYQFDHAPKLRAALEAALDKPYFWTANTPSAGYKYHHSVGDGIFLEIGTDTLNPNVLDPEDFHLCGRVLRATFRKELPDGNIQGAVWGRDPDGGRDFDTMIDDCTLQPIEDPNGWTIESIPSLGLTR